MAGTAMVGKDWHVAERDHERDRWIILKLLLFMKNKIPKFDNFFILF